MEYVDEDLAALPCSRWIRGSKWAALREKREIDGIKETVTKVASGDDAPSAVIASDRRRHGGGGGQGGG
jgi:hypothetical protein